MPKTKIFDWFSDTLSDAETVEPNKEVLDEYAEYGISMYRDPHKKNVHGEPAEAGKSAEKSSGTGKAASYREVSSGNSGNSARNSGRKTSEYREPSRDAANRKAQSGQISQSGHREVKTRRQAPEKNASPDKQGSAPKKKGLSLSETEIVRIDNRNEAARAARQRDGSGYYDARSAAEREAAAKAERERQAAYEAARIERDRQEAYEALLRERERRAAQEEAERAERERKAAYEAAARAERERQAAHTAERERREKQAARDASREQRRNGRQASGQSRPLRQSRNADNSRRQAEQNVQAGGSVSKGYRQALQQHDDAMAEAYRGAIARNVVDKEKYFAEPEKDSRKSSGRKSSDKRNSEKKLSEKKPKNKARKEKKTREKEQGEKKRGVKAFIFVFLILLALGGMVYAVLGKVNHDKIDKDALGAVDVPGYTNIAILGVDSRDMESASESRTDMIMIASINDETKDITLTSVYRDTYMPMGDSGDFDKITHAHVYGGPEMTITALNRTMDLNIKDYVLINFKGVADGIDALGGIELDIEEYEIEEMNKYTKETAKIIGRENYGLVKEPGTQRVDGCQAVSYGRIRKDVGDDFKRTERMRIVMQKVMKELRSMNPVKLMSFANSLLPEVKTSLNKSEIMDYMLQLRDMDLSGSEGFPYTAEPGFRGDVSYVFSMNMYEDVVTLHREVFGQEDYVPTEKAQEIAAEVTYY